MEIKRTISKVVYRLESKPDGGFIARSSDPGTPPLEAPTRDELQGKIQATISANLAAEFTSLKLPAENEQLKFAFHIEAKPGGGFVARSTDPSQPPIEGATQEEVKQRLAEKLAGMLGNDVLPELSQALGKPTDSGDVKVVVNRQVGLSTRFGSPMPTLSDVQELPGTVQAEGVNESIVDLNRNRPIISSAGGNWGLFRFLVALLVLGAMAYFFLHYR
jgi:hypothetical protein